ncbi:UNVERIFIED_CONTAM: 3-ketoacyl-CoA thiolase 2, peroxisomal [Sesamum indicum]
MEKATNRQRILLQHLRPTSSVSHQTSDSSLSPSICLAGDSAAYHRTAAFGDDIVIVAAYRTAICKSKRGGFKDTLPDDLLAAVLKALIDRTNLNPAEVGDIIVGTVLAPGSLRAIECRMAALYAGFPGIAAGLESMTVDAMGAIQMVNPKVISHQRAAAAAASGKFKDEIIPVSTKIVDPTTGEVRPVTISVDDGIRPNTNMKDLAKLKPAFKKNGTTTAGNASQVSDGAGAVLLMKRSLAMQKGLPILGIFRSFAAVGVDPGVMGIGPAVAIPPAVKSAGLELSDIDLFEINEAFASQFVYCCKKLDLDREKVNVNGGAMALGHPLGATGSGMGAAAVLERGDCVDDLCNARAVSENNFLSKDAM